jgi:hypothetical protein
MDDSARIELERLRKDYSRVAGEPFRWFYCPFLFRDEDVELCKGHLLNQAFNGSTRIWTIQRKDLDNFYGTFFESNFVLIQYLESTPLQRIIESPELAKRVPVRVSLEGVKVDSYPYRQGPVPKDHTAIVVESPSGRDLSLILKIAPDEVAKRGQDLQLSVAKDLTLESLVSLMKAAHLTLFRMLGYNYALSAGGIDMGTALGSFFLNNYVKRKPEVLENARDHFWKFRNMVRPVVSHTPVLNGTISDKQLYICETTDGLRWAFIVFIRLPGSLHAVVVPILGDSEGAGRFHRFLDAGESTLIVRFCEFKDGIFQAHPRTTTFTWPEVGAFADK